jgi:hypothetical protein
VIEHIFVFIDKEKQAFAKGVLYGLGNDSFADVSCGDADGHVVLFY